MKDELMKVILMITGFLRRYVPFLLNSSTNCLNPLTVLSAEIMDSLAWKPVYPFDAKFLEQA